jgi:diaminopimelate decarboxylase
MARSSWSGSDCRRCSTLASRLPFSSTVPLSSPLTGEAYAQAVAGLNAIVGYAVKANSNPALLRRLAGFGAGAVVVSDCELRLALESGFAPQQMLMHGNGKRPRDLEAALQAGILLSVDSEFDLEQIISRATALGVTARLLLRVNPDIDPQVHPYISTGLLDSKFGFAEGAVERLRPRLQNLSSVEVVGLHCHLGSTLKSVQPLRDAARLLAVLVNELRRDGHPIQILDMGGGLGIDYSRGRDQIPTPDEVTEAVRPVLDELGLQLFLEPGRSLVARAGALIGRVLGVKDNGRKHFVVTDASMAQLIRPCLYGAFHSIELLEESVAGPQLAFDVVGPICESSDFSRPRPAAAYASNRRRSHHLRRWRLRLCDVEPLQPTPGLRRVFGRRRQPSPRPQRRDVRRPEPPLQRRSDFRGNTPAISSPSCSRLTGASG